MLKYFNLYLRSETDDLDSFKVNGMSVIHI